MLDSGAALDLVSREHVSASGLPEHPTNQPVQLQTAAGPLTVQTVAPMFVPELHQSIQPSVLQDSPAVLSLGERCMEDGYV